MAVIGEIAVNVVARIKKFSRGMDMATWKTRSSTKAMRKDVKDLGRTIAKFTTFAVGIGGIGGFVHSLSNASKELEDLGLNAAKLGIAERTLGGLQFAASKAGVSITQLNTGIQRMARRVAEARKGTGEAVKAIKELGLSADKLAESGTEKAFLRIGNAINKVADAGDRVRLFMRFFDTEGVGLANLFAQGPAKIQDAIARSNFADPKAIIAATELEEAKAEWTNMWKAVTNFALIQSNRARRNIVRMESEQLPTERRRLFSPHGGFASPMFRSYRELERDRRRAADQVGGASQEEIQRAFRNTRRSHAGSASGAFFGMLRAPLRLMTDGMEQADKALKKLQDRLFMPAARGLINRHFTDPMVLGIRKFRKATLDAQNALAGIAQKSVHAQALGRPGARRELQNIRFNRLLDQITGSQSTRRMQINPFIESTSAEGFAAIKRSQKANAEPLLRVNKSILAELKNLGVILGRGEELVGVGP